MRKATWAPSALGTLLAAGCVIPQHEDARETLDENTGTTVTAMGAPLEFYSPQPEFGLKAATFAHLGAFEVNRMGTLRLLLWLSVLPGETPGTQPQPAPSEPLQLAVLADGTEVVPARIDATARDLGLSNAPFKRPADWAREGYFDVSLEQLRVFESATVLAVTLTTADGRVQRFDQWSPDRAALVRFLERVATR